MKHLMMTALLVLLAACIWATGTPTVHEAAMTQRTDGSKIIDVTYTMADPDMDSIRESALISLLISADGGSTFTITPTRANLSGDIGAVMLYDWNDNKHIIWNAGAESYSLDGSQYKVKVVADYFPLNFAYVSGGSFTRSNGSVVTVSSIIMDRHETVQSEFQNIMGSNPAHDYGVGNSFPVYYVTWYDAIEYCNKRSIREGITPCYRYQTDYTDYGTNPANWPGGWNTSVTYDLHPRHIRCDWAATGYRLPTEAEWHFAALGGNQSQGYTYSGSNTLTDVGWYVANSTGATHQTGDLAVNELGIWDMSGNVMEWIWDIHEEYPSGPQTNPHGAASGFSGSRLARGGSWEQPAMLCENSYRYGGGNVLHNQYNLGFRVCRIAP
jgi:formylglycine-generating enzyme required for sulfatase activity